MELPKERNPLGEERVGNLLKQFAVPSIIAICDILLIHSGGVPQQAQHGAVGAHPGCCGERATGPGAI